MATYRSFATLDAKCCHGFIMRPTLWCVPPCTKHSGMLWQRGLPVEFLLLLRRAEQAVLSYEIHLWNLYSWPMHIPAAISRLRFERSSRILITIAKWSCV